MHWNIVIFHSLLLVWQREQNGLPVKSLCTHRLKPNKNRWGISRSVVDKRAKLIHSQSFHFYWIWTCLAFVCFGFLRLVLLFSVTSLLSIKDDHQTIDWKILRLRIETLKPVKYRTIKRFFLLPFFAQLLFTFLLFYFIYFFLYNLREYSNDTSSVQSS